MSLEQNSIKKRDSANSSPDRNNKEEEAEKPKNKYIGPFNITHSISLRYQAILKILRRAGFENP